MLYVINFKTYKKATGRNALKLAKICEAVSRGYKKNIIIAVGALDLREIASKVKIPVYAQHIDNVESGAHTGSIVAETARNAGAKGTLLNHSEKRISLEQIKESISRAKKAGLKTIVCAPTAELVKKIAGLKPDFIAVEPPALIGGKISVSTAEPELIAHSVKAAGKIPLLCGAGVHTRQDVLTANKLGAKGVLIASGFVESPNAMKSLLELLV